MYVACPSCQSLFQVHPAHLRGAHGEVRCGVCQNRFNACDAVFEEGQQALAWAQQRVASEIDALVDKALDQMPGATDQSAHPASSSASLEREGAPLDEQDAFGAAQAEQVTSSRTTQNPRASAEGTRGTAREAYRFHSDADFYAQPINAEYSLGQQADSAPGSDMAKALLWAEDDTAAARGTPWGSLVAVLFLVLLLVGQYAYLERYRLASIGQLRPVLDTFCELLRCDLPLRRDVSQVEMVGREVRDHPNVAEALLISATFVNRAPFRQAYPSVQVSFSDVSGSPLALRRFRPHEYLDSDKDPSAGMAPGEEAQLMLEMIDPGERAVSFQFDFL